MHEKEALKYSHGVEPIGNKHQQINPATHVDYHTYTPDYGEGGYNTGGAILLTEGESYRSTGTAFVMYICFL